MNKKRKTVYRGSGKNWAMMMNKIYGPNCRFKASEYEKTNKKLINYD